MSDDIKGNWDGISIAEIQQSSQGFGFTLSSPTVSIRLFRMGKMILPPGQLEFDAKRNTPGHQSDFDMVSVGAGLFRGETFPLVSGRL
jgi:hypothetical protein